jgi:putative ABC transport system ATP-binding protein
MRARASFKAHLPADAVHDVDFYDPGKVMLGASLRDNLMFGRIGYGIADARKKVAGIVRAALARAGLDGELYRIGLNTDCGIRGRFLPGRLKLAVPLAQALIKAPQIAVLDVAALVATSPEPEALIARLREHCASMTLFLLLGDASLSAGISPRIVFSGPSGVIEDDDRDGEDEVAAEVPLRQGAERLEARP